MDDDDLLLKTYAPFLYLNSNEDNMPSSVEWMLQRSRLRNGAGTVVLDPVETIANLVAANAGSDWYLQLRSENDRGGQGTMAPVYATVRPITQAGLTVGNDLMYWYYYPFNGNLFDIDKAIGILSAVIFAGSLASMWFPPFGYLLIAAASIALNYLNNVEGISMHESDWEHVTVRVDTANSILGVYCAAHSGEGGWKYQPVEPGVQSRSAYQLQGTRPVIYAGLRSHAAYTVTGTIERFGGFANDQTEQALLWDPLEGATDKNPMGYLVNMGHDILNPPEGQEWIQYPGTWGNLGGGGGVYVEWFGSELQEYSDGKPGPAVRDSWTTGDGEGPTSWPSPVQQLPFIPAAGAVALAQYKGFLCLVYVQTGNAGPVGCGVYNGFRWTQPQVAGLTVLGSSASMCMWTFQGTLNNFFRVSTDLEWAQLVIDDTGNTSGWAYQPFPPSLRSPRATGEIAAASIGGMMYLVFNRDGKLAFFSYDGATWADQTPVYPVLSSWTVDGPVALSGYAGTLYLAYGSNGSLRQAEYTPVAGWVDSTSASPSRPVSQSAGLSSFGGYLYLLYADASGTLHWTRRTAQSPWLVDEHGNDLVIANQICSGRCGLAVFPTPVPVADPDSLADDGSPATSSFLALVFAGSAPAPGSLYFTDMLSR